MKNRKWFFLVLSGSLLLSVSLFFLSDHKKDEIYNEIVNDIPEQRFYVTEEENVKAAPYDTKSNEELGQPQQIPNVDLNKPVYILKLPNSGSK